MFKMKYFVTFIVIQYYWTHTLCNPYLFKVKLIKSRPIFNYGNIVTLQNILGDDDIVLTDESKYPGEVYTSIQCTYADAVVDLLQTFFEIFLYGVNSHDKFDYPDIKSYTQNWLISAYIHFNNIKSPIVKMIDRLFLYLDQTIVLRTTDQSLLKALLSINLFLYNSQNNNPIVTNNQNESEYIINDYDFDQTIKNVRSLNQSIIEMIGLVERFRSKRCVLLDPYKYNYIVNAKMRDNSILDAMNIRKLLKPTLKTINVLINKGSEYYNDQFVSNMNITFDPEYLLFENLLSHNNGFLGNIPVVLNGNPSDLKSVYLNLKNTVSMESVLEFQHIFIKVISEVFYREIYSLSMNTLDRNTINNLMELQTKYKEFVYYMLPINCSINVCNKILKNLEFLDKTLGSFDNKKTSNILVYLGKHFGPAMNIQLINKNYQPNLFDDSIIFSSLFHMMWNDPQYETFKRVVRLLSYEPYTNSDFHISNVFNHVDITVYESHNFPLINDMVELQYALFAFSALLKTNKSYEISNTVVNYSKADLSDLHSIGFNTPENGTGNRKEAFRPITNDIISVVVKLYTKYENKPAVKNILLPFLVHFKHTENYSSPTSTYEIYTILQMSLLTISIIENFLIRNFSFTFYSIFLYNTFTINPVTGETLTEKLRDDLNTYANKSEMNIDKTLEYLNSLYDANYYNTFFPEDDTDIKFIWDGSQRSGYDIYHNVLVGVTDFNDLIRLQWFGVKWFTSKIVLHLYNTAESFTCGINYHDTFDRLKFKLQEFLGEEFPISIKIFLDDIFNSTLIALSVHFTFLHATHYEKFGNIISESFSVLDAKPKDKHTLCEESHDYINDFVSKFNQLKVFSKLDFLGTQNTLNSTELGLSPLKKHIPNKIINILISVV